MPNRTAILWSAAIIGVALLNIFDVLPDWTTIAAVLTFPFFVGQGRCLRPRGGAEK